MHQFELTEDQLQIQEMARKFTADAITPNAAEWDEKHIFPRDTIREAAERSIRSGFAHVLPHLQAALERHPVPGVTAESLAQQFQVATQGGIILAKALNDPAPARAAFDHLERYLRLLFGRA